MNEPNHHIPLDVAHQVLEIFRITEPSNAYDRWVKPNGFELKDFDAVLFESLLVFSIDWRAWLQEELEDIAKGLAKLDIELELDLDEDGESGYIRCDGKQAFVSHNPDNDLGFGPIIRSVQTIIPSTTQFQSSPSNDGGDTEIFAVLPVKDWLELESVASTVAEYFFRPL